MDNFFFNSHGLFQQPCLISPRSLAYFICWDRLSLSFTALLESIHKRFNLFIIRSSASLIGTEGGDSWVWDCALLVPSKTIAITRPTENICGNSMSLETPECEMGDGMLKSRRPVATPS